MEKFIFVLWFGRSAPGGVKIGKKCSELSVVSCEKQDRKTEIPEDRALDAFSSSSSASSSSSQSSTCPQGIVNRKSSISCSSFVIAPKGLLIVACFSDSRKKRAGISYQRSAFSL